MSKAKQRRVSNMKRLKQHSETSTLSPEEQIIRMSPKQIEQKMRELANSPYIRALALQEKLKDHYINK
jgi:hypothetical protein